MKTLHILDTLDQTKSIPRVAHFISKYSKSDSKFITPVEISKENCDNYDFIHVHTAIGAFSLRKYEDKLIHHYYGLSWISNIKNIYTIRHWFNEKLMMNRYHRVITCSHYLANEIKIKYGRDAEVLPLAVDFDKFKPNKIPKKIQYFNRNKSFKKPKYLFVGKLTERKNLEVIIRALNILKLNTPDAKLSIVGTGSQREYLETLVNELNLQNNVTFHGKVDDDELLKLYNSTTVYITASLWEGFGMPIIEAMACGKPVIASNIAAHREIIDSARIGYLANNDPNDWANKMRNILYTNWEKSAYDYAKSQTWTDYVNKLYI